ncbi:MAG: hypothetical protein K2G30_08370, partial [Muribaculaceae bacterium]|nr:hypothetical protein [Muribaculaceae bacterium]
MRNYPLKKTYLVMILLLGALANALPAAAFTLDRYAASSVLSSGRWVQVSVTQTGMHLVSEQTLRGWGFANPSQVRIYGYGASRLPAQLSVSTYYDDLPQTPSEWVEGRGLLFYAEGPVSKQTTTGQYRRPAQNYYTTEGYYFLTDSRPDDERLTPPAANTTPTAGTAPATTFNDFLYHEQELTSPGEAGLQLVGEDFRYTRDQQFQFSLTDPVAGQPAYLEVVFLAKSATASSTIG